MPKQEVLSVESNDLDQINSAIRSRNESGWRLSQIVPIYGVDISFHGLGALHHNLFVKGSILVFEKINNDS